MKRRSTWPRRWPRVRRADAASRLVARPDDEQRRAQPRGVEPRCAGAAEAPRREVPLERRLREVAAADLVDGRRRETPRTRGSASRRGGRRSCCGSRRRRSSRTAARGSLGENPAAFRSHSDEWPMGSAAAAVVGAPRISDRLAPSTACPCIVADQRVPVSSSTAPCEARTSANASVTCAEYRRSTSTGDVLVSRQAIEIARRCCRIRRDSDGGARRI